MQNDTAKLFPTRARARVSGQPRARFTYSRIVTFSRADFQPLEAKTTMTTETVKMTKAELDEAMPEINERIAKRVRELAMDPMNRDVPRDRLMVQAVKAEFARNPQLAETWKHAPGTTHSSAS